MLKHQKFFRLLICLFVSYGSFSSIIVTGVNQQIKTNIEHRIEYKVRNTPSVLSEQIIDQLHNETIEAIKPFGYFNPSIKITSDPNIPGNTLIKVALGPITHIEKVNIIYVSNPEDAVLESSIQQVATSYGYAQFHIENLGDLITDIKIASLTAGYSDVLVTRGETTANRYTNLAHVTILITPKEINRYGHIILPEGSSPACFNKYHNIVEGEKYNEEKIVTFQKNMMRSGQFTQSSIQPQPRKVIPHIQDIVVEYERIKPFRYFIGLGIASNLTDKKLVPEIKANVTKNNLGGCGIELKNILKYSRDTFAFESKLLIPSGLNQDSYNMLSMQFNNNMIKSNDTSNFWHTGWLFHYASDLWIHKLSANLLFEESTLNQGTPYTTTLVYPQYELAGKYANSEYQFKAKGKILGGLKSIASEIDFFKVLFSSYWKIGSHGIVAKNQNGLGKIWTESFNQFPISMQFYLGGADSHRGLSYHEINEGKEFFLSKNSLQMRIQSDFLIGGFYDTGYCTSTEDYTLKPAVGALLSYSPSFGNFELSVGRLTNSTKWVILLNVEPGEDFQ